MFDFVFAAARRAVPVTRGHNRSHSLPVPRRPGVLTREELRRAVAEVIG